MSADVLTLRAMNRATMARKLLLDRSDMAVLEAVEHLVGMQGQVPLNPYLGLWSRLRGFRPKQLVRLISDRSLVRIVVMRHLEHHARQAHGWRPPRGGSDGALEKTVHRDGDSRSPPHVAPARSRGRLSRRALRPTLTA